MDHIPDKTQGHDFFLWQQLKQGNKSALHKIYTGHYAAMLDYGLRLADERTFVKKCIQKVFRDLISRLDKIKYPTHTRFFLLYSLREHIFEQANKGRMPRVKFQRVNGNGFHYNPEFFAPSDRKDDSPSNIHEKDQSSDSGLNFREKEAMYLKFHHQLNEVEISQMIGLSDRSVRELLVQALKKYRTRRNAANSH